MPGSLRIPQLHMFCICQIPSLSAPPDKPLLILQIPLQCCDLSHGSLSSRGRSFWILCSSYRVIIVQLLSRIQLFAASICLQLCWVFTDKGVIKFQDQILLKVTADTNRSWQIPRGMWDLSSPTRMKPAPLALEGEVLTTGPSKKTTNGI